MSYWYHILSFLLSLGLFQQKMYFFKDKIMVHNFGKILPVTCNCYRFSHAFLQLKSQLTPSRLKGHSYEKN
jgi:hypothetical protein